jgi:hypothetical protein
LGGKFFTGDKIKSWLLLISLKSFLFDSNLSLPK